MAQNFNYNALNKTQLKDQLRARGLKLGGNKPELIARLHAKITGVPEPTVAPVVIPTGVPVVTAVPVTKPKVSKKNPVEVLMNSIRDSEQTFGVAIAALLNVYGAGDLHPGMIELLVNRTETFPVTLSVPATYHRLKELKVAELKKILKLRGEKVGGKKDELIHRIMNPTPQHGVPAGPLTLPPVGEFQLPPVGVIGVAPVTAPAPATGLNAAPGLPLPVVPGIQEPDPVAPTLTVPDLPTTTSPNQDLIPTVPDLPTAGSPHETVALPTLPTVGSPAV